MLHRSKNTLHFIRLHGPWPLLCRYAEELNLRAPIQVNEKKIALRLLLMHYLILYWKFEQKTFSFLFFISLLKRSSFLSGHSSRFNLSQFAKKGSKDRICSLRFSHALAVAFWNQAEKSKISNSLQPRDLYLSNYTNLANILLTKPCIVVVRKMFQNVPPSPFWCNFSSPNALWKWGPFFLFLSHFVCHLNENRLSTVHFC